MATDWKKLLNDRQYEAVMHDDGPLLILAGAGSGKTRVLTCRLSHLIEAGVPAERILQLTFTNKAADEMKTRAIEMSDDRCAEVMACTYHSFCSKMLHEYGSVVGLPKNATILNIPDARSVINIVKFQLFQDFPKGYPNEMTLANIFSSALNKQKSISAILATDPRMRRYSSYLDSIESIGEAYSHYKREHDMVDYDDLIAMFKKLLTEHEDIRQEIEGRYDYIMVDEYQDTNPMQDDIVFLLRKANPNLMVVGDDYQSIYAFRGSDVNNILKFPRKEPLLGTPRAGEMVPLPEGSGGTDAPIDIEAIDDMVYLDTNYRSCNEVIDFANELMRRNARFGFPKDMTATFDGGHRPRLVSVTDEAAQARFAVDELRRLHDEEGIPWKEMAVIARTNAGNDAVSTIMEEEGIPKKRFGGTSILETEVVNDAIAYIRCATNNKDRLAWYRLSSSLPSVGNRNAERVVDAMDDSMAFLDRPAWQKCSGILDLLQMRSDILAMRQMNLSDMVDLACQRALESSREKALQEETEVDPILAEQNRARRERDTRAMLDRFKTMASHYAYPRELLDAIALQELGDDIEGLSDDELEIGDDLPEDAVTVSTIHSVKGLEFDAVIILDCVNGIFPKVKASDFGTQDDMEELRCFYVAVTRAKRHLVMIAPGRVKIWNSIRPARQSHYLDEIGDSLLERVVL